MDIEDGEIFSGVDERILDEDPEEVLSRCAICKILCKKSFAYSCEADKHHLFCITCAYKSMFLSKNCPPGERCRKPGEAAAWFYNTEEVNKCSRLFLTMQRISPKTKSKR